MITGVGLDLCEISRMDKLLQDGRFLARFFSAEEQEYIRGKGKTAAQSMAGIYAAKEALTKALGVGLSGGEMADIAVLHDHSGAPYYDLRGNWARLAAEKGVTSLHLSISHESGLAAAVCVAERNEEKVLQPGKNREENG